MGSATDIGEKGKDTQHQGYGTQLMKKAEEKAKELGKNKVVVISAVGTREYYRKFGYEKEGPYMVKNLD